MGLTLHSHTIILHTTRALASTFNLYIRVDLATRFLEFINQLLFADDGALLINTYQAKKFLRDMGLGYEKILACHNDCMLF
jgi:hypothetical protein